MFEFMLFPYICLFGDCLLRKMTEPLYFMIERIKLVFATNNRHKLAEVQSILGDDYTILGLHDIACDYDIPETETTLEGNALLKARYVWENYKIPCFADDTGLEVEALDGAPGVYSARYAGEHKSSDDNIVKLLSELSGKENRKAHFRTSIAYIREGRECLFDGIINGQIIEERKGNTGFGYDPVFMPDGYTQTFAELGDDVKNDISHRALAIKKLQDFLAKERT